MRNLRCLFGVANPPLHPRHELSGLNSHFTANNLSFSEYVAETRSMLGAVYAKRGVANLGKIIDGNSPFELNPHAGSFAGKTKKYRRGVLLTHGLTDSPYFMRYLAVFFQDQGFRVMAVMLPGHGTQPGDLLDVTWQEWLKAVAYGADRLDEEVDEIYLAGFSTGGALSVYQSLFDTRVRGIFLFSPALKISSRAALAGWHKLYSWLIPSAKWVDIKPDTDIYKYESLTKNAVTQTYRLIKKLNHRLQMQELNIPVFTAASADDMTVDVSATVQFMANSRHALRKLVIYSKDRNTNLMGFPVENCEWINSMFPEQKILGSSHTSIVLPEQDEHYGASGKYSNCVHYYPDDIEKYQVCTNHSQPVLQGEITSKNLEAGVLRRLMYNPNFASLKISMQKFIESLP